MNNWFKESKINTFFSAIDIFFSNYFNPKNDEESLFLSYLFFISRNGYVSLFVDEKNIYPDPKEFIYEENFEFGIWELGKI